MKKIVSIIIVSIFLFSGCKNEPKTDIVVEEAINEEADKKELIVEFAFKTNKEDEFKIMLNNIEVDDLQKMNINVVETVPPSAQPDKIIANFGERISNNLLINLGNSEVKSVEISAIDVRYGEVFISSQTAEDLDKYFAFNKFIDWDPASLTVSTKRVDGKLFPVISARRRLINALQN